MGAAKPQGFVGSAAAGRRPSARRSACVSIAALLAAVMVCAALDIRGRGDAEVSRLRAGIATASLGDRTAPQPLAFAAMAAKATAELRSAPTAPAHRAQQNFLVFFSGHQARGAAVCSLVLNSCWNPAERCSNCRLP